MQRRNVIDLINQDLPTLIDDYGEVDLQGGFYTPSFIIPLVCYLNSKHIDERRFRVHPDNKTYFTTIGLYKQLWGIEDAYQRVNCGKRYSPIVCLNSVEHVDKATTEIGSCIKSMLNNTHSVGLERLIEVIGEVHDNVWSHGKSTGFSMAQIYTDPRSNTSFIEFTLADKGHGFLPEMRRVGKSVQSHRDAIEWCIQEGNSTKHSKDEDAWLQRVPGDLIGENPMGLFGGDISDNHHQGLGLFHLIDLVEKHNGELYLISGDTALHIRDKQKTYLELCNAWKGVIISCRFDRDELLSTDTQKTIDDQNIDDIITRLRGD